MKRVLVVDDDPAIARLVGAALKEADVEHSLDYCSDGGQGRLKAAGGEYDLVTLDLAMPFVGGVEALGEMKRHPRASRIPVIVITALQDPGLHDRVKAMGAAAVIQKPFELWQLIDAVRLIFAGNKLTPEPILDADLGPLLES
jgi:DNA-binding response OmpR family regulator